MQTFLYPNVNVPPIAYKVKYEENIHPLEEYVTVLPEGEYSNRTQQTRPLISFVPRVWGESELLAIHGNVYHPEQHLYANNELVSPVEIREEIVEIPVSPPSTKKPKTNKPTKSDEQMMKYYVSGLSIVGLLILYRMISKSKY